MPNLGRRRPFRAAIDLLSLFVLVWAGSGSASVAQELSAFKGTWTKTNPPTRTDQPGIGAWIKIEAEAPGRVMLSWTAPAVIADAQGQHGANFVWRNDNAQCWYEMKRLGMTLTLRLTRSEPAGVCLEDSRFEHDSRRDAERFTACDLLAAHPNDARRPVGVLGIPSKQIDVAKAVPACQAAISDRPLDPRMMFQLGRAFFRAGDPASLAEAIRLFRKAAEGGDAMAMGALGLAYAGGHGVAMDGSEAVRWLQKSADSGNPAALGFLGHMHEHGLGVPKDEAEAARLYRQSADSGVSMSMGALGLMYRDGRGVAKDEAEAVRWLRRGADGGDEFSRNALKRMER